MAFREGPRTALKKAMTDYPFSGTGRLAGVNSPRGLPRALAVIAGSLTRRRFAARAALDTHPPARSGREAVHHRAAKRSAKWGTS